MDPEDPHNPAQPRKSAVSGQSGGVQDPGEPLARVFICRECGFDYSRVSWRIVSPASLGVVVGLVGPLRCPECGAWQVRAGPAVIRGGLVAPS